MTLRKFAQASVQAAQKASAMAAKADSLGKSKDNRYQDKWRKKREADVPSFIGITSPKGM